MTFAAWKLYRGTLWNSTKLLKVLTWSIPLPLLACQLGWIAAEVGRQPWIVYHLMRTQHAVSVTVGAGEILFSIILLALIYLFLLYTLLVMMKKKIKQGFSPVEGGY
jgi:cytochrome d ubiquinol oxidase subunit I